MINLKAYLVDQTDKHIHDDDIVETKCQDCSTVKSVRFGALKRTVKKRNAYRCTKCASNTPEAKIQRSLQSQKAWEDTEYRERASSIQKKIANTEEGRLQRSIQSKRAWGDESYRENQEKRINELFQSEQHRKLVSERNKRLYEENPEEYLKTRTSVLWSREAKINHKNALADPEYRLIHRNLALERFKSDEYKAKIAKGLERFSSLGKRSAPEKQLDALLNELGLVFQPEKAVGPYRFDAYVPVHDAYFEIQGEYWHSLPNNQRRDATKSQYLRSSYPDAKLICIWDYEFLTPGLVKSRIQTALGVGKPNQVNFEFTDLIFSNQDAEACRKFMGAYHYAQYGKQAKFLYGAVLGQTLIQATKIGPLSRSESAEKEGYKTNECYELDRFCIHPEYHKRNFASFALTKATDEFFRVNPHVKALISFADSTYGHSGTIYKAAGWQKVGTVKPDYHYVDKNGWKLHKKSLYNQARGAHMKEKDWAEQHGWVKVFGKSKTKYLLLNPL